MDDWSPTPEQLAIKAKLEEWLPAAGSVCIERYRIINGLVQIRATRWSEGATWGVYLRYPHAIEMSALGKTRYSNDAWSTRLSVRSIEDVQDILLHYVGNVVRWQKAVGGPLVDQYLETRDV
tara:strand:- start:156 stop:521 length:366 start_codon:yes stop_codon:yes gene_type:complete